MMRIFSYFVTILQFVLIHSAVAESGVNLCLDHGHELSPNEDQVIQWLNQGKNQFHNRAHVRGKFIQYYIKNSAHEHFQIEISGNQGTSTTIEVVYNVSFGGLPLMTPGVAIEICGDYITSSRATTQYPLSPDRGIIHWVHSSFRTNHDSGFVMVDGKLFGNLGRTIQTAGIELF